MSSRGLSSACESALAKRNINLCHSNLSHSAYPPESTEAARHPKITTRTCLVHVSLWRPNKWRFRWPWKVNYCLGAVLGSSFITGSVTCLPEQSILSPVSASGKHSFTCLPSKTPSTQLIFQRHQRFQLHGTSEKPAAASSRGCVVLRSCVSGALPLGHLLPSELCGSWASES